MEKKFPKKVLDVLVQTGQNVRDQMRPSVRTYGVVNAAAEKV